MSLEAGLGICTGTSWRVGVGVVKSPSYVCLEDDFLTICEGVLESALSGHSESLIHGLLGLSACIFDRVRVTQLMFKDYRMHVKERGKGVRQVGGLTNTSYANQTNETPTSPGADPSPMGSRLQIYSWKQSSID